MRLEPLEVYELAKSRGMDFVREAQAVHVLCNGISPADHEWLHANRHDVESCAEYLSDRQVTCALAHPFYAVAAPLTAQHRRRLAQLFPIWETRNGSRAKELNRPAFVYTETHGGTAIGGSDDHAGVDIARTYTDTPPAAGPQEFLANISSRAGRPDPQAILRIGGGGGRFSRTQKFKLARSDGDQPRVAVVADGLGATHGVSRTIARLRERGCSATRWR